MLSGTAAVLDAGVQGIIDAVIRRTHTDTGIGHGYLDAEDVRSHLQEMAVRSLQRYDPSQAKLTSFLWPRLCGAALDLIRSHGPTTTRSNRPGAKRAQAISLQRWLDSGRAADNQAIDRPGALLFETEAFHDKESAEALAGVDELVDLTLALSEMPSRLRLVLYLLFYEGLQLDQVAARLSTTREAIRALRDAALLKMRLALLRRG